MEIDEIRDLLGKYENGQIAKRYLAKALREHQQSRPDLPLLFKGPKSASATATIEQALIGQGYDVRRRFGALNDKTVWYLAVGGADGDEMLTPQGVPPLPAPDPLESPYAYREGMTIFDFPAYESGMSRRQRWDLERQLPRWQKFDPEFYEENKKLLELDDAARAARDPRHKYLPPEEGVAAAAAVKAAPVLPLPPPDEPPPRKRRARGGKTGGGKGGGALPSITIQR